MSKSRTVMAAGALAAAAAAAAATGGCGGSGEPAAVSPTPLTPLTRSTGGSTDPDARLRSLPPALRFEATTLDGRRFVGSDLAERPVVFWFWAPGCSACRAGGPDVAAVAKEYGDRVSFVGVAGPGGSTERKAEFVERTGTGGLTHLDDRAGTLHARLKVTARPSYLFMRRDGGTDRVTGPLGAGDLERRVRPLAGG